jgi:hypothetical protein
MAVGSAKRLSAVPEISHLRGLIWWNFLVPAGTRKEVISAAEPENGEDSSFTRGCQEAVRRRIGVARQNSEELAARMPLKAD